MRHRLRLPVAFGSGSWFDVALRVRASAGGSAAQPTRWTIAVSEETDLALRRFVGARGIKNGSHSRFVEEAVRWRVFDETVQEVRNRKQGLPPEELEQVIEEQVREARAEKAAQGE